MASPAFPGGEPGDGPRVDDLVQQVEQLRAENEQLQRAVASHAVIDQAIGVLVMMARIGPDEGFTMLREVSQRTNTKLSSIAEQIVKHAQGAGLPETVLVELHDALARQELIDAGGRAARGGGAGGRVRRGGGRPGRRPGCPGAQRGR